MRLWFPILLSFAGCGLQGSADPGPVAAAQPVAVQQMHANPEAVTGRFVSLVDFEPEFDAPDDAAGSERHFAVIGAEGGGVQLVFNITHTGTAALEAVLPVGGALRFRSPAVHRFGAYTLLSMAVHVQEVRDDLQITLDGADGRWVSHRRLVQPGWNTVLVDLAGPQRGGRLGLSQFDTIGLRFAAADEPVTMHLDDILLIDNRREIPNTPPQVTVVKVGLDYRITLPGWSEAIHLRQNVDGLWRLGVHQPSVQLSGEDLAPDGSGEDLRMMGDRKVGRVELLEANPLRVRLANTWYFPPQAGRWFDMDVRQIRWEYTFCGDGRWVTSMLLNNAGGQELTAIDVRTPAPVAFSDGTVGDRCRVADFDGLIGRYSMLAVPAKMRNQGYYADFARTAIVDIRLGRPAAAGGLIDADGFRESEGCYVARAVGGNCRIELTPVGDSLTRPMVRVIGPWTGPVAANCDGMPLRPVVPTDDGVLVAVEAVVTGPTLIEFAGPVDATSR